jgi:general secretion pathway protein H
LRKALTWPKGQPTPSIGGSRPHDGGFTLVELLVVIAIMALVMVLGLPQLTGAQGKAELEAGAREIAAALRETRSQAIILGHQEAFVIDTAGGAFRAGETSTRRHLPEGVRSSLFTTTQERISQTVGRIQFFADGSSTGGGVHLTHGSRQSDVLVDWLTGRISTSGTSVAAR